MLTRKNAEIVAKVFSSLLTMNILMKKGPVNMPGEAKDANALRALAADISESAQYLNNLDQMTKELHCVH